MSYKLLDVADPFTTDRFTRLIHLSADSNNGLTSTERAALLSRYSRSTKSMIDLMDTEFQDKNRGPSFMKKLISEYGDDSVQELASEQVGIEGLSLLAASKLTDQRVGISFLEKSTRYVPFSPDSFYIPAELYHYGLVDEYKSLCGLSYKTFNFIYNDVIELSHEKYPIKNCLFFDSKLNKEVIFENLSLESDVKNAENAYKRAVKDKAFDNAGYCWLLGLKTNTGFNGNARAIEYLLQKCYLSPLSELKALSYHLYSLLSQSIEPFITRSSFITQGEDQVITSKNPFEIYSGGNSIIGVYKHNIVNLLHTYDTFQEGLEDIEPKRPKTMKQNTNLVKNILTEIGLSTKEGNKINLKESKSNIIRVDPESFRPSVDIVSFMNEQWCIDQLCSAILFENNENLLDYDEQNINNIDENLRILDVDTSKVKAGILFDIINGNKLLEDFNGIDTSVNRTTENTLTFNDINAYWEENNTIKDNPIYQDYLDKNKSTINKEQNFIINKYVENRKSRRDKLGRPFEFIDYTMELSSSFRVYRDLKRHRQMSLISSPLVTARNSYSSFIFPDLYIKNQHLFNEYKHLIDESFKLYNKIIKKSNDYHTAQYVLPTGVRHNYLIKTNLRHLDHMLSLRTQPSGMDEYRQICQGIYSLLMVIHPNLLKILKFVDMSQYPLGRLKAETRKEYKLSQLDSGV